MLKSTSRFCPYCGKQAGNNANTRINNNYYQPPTDPPGRKPVGRLILLLIAVCVLALVWRFSRMKHISLKDILTNAGVTSPSGFKEFVIYGVDSREGNLTEDAHSDTKVYYRVDYIRSDFLHRAGDAEGGSG